MGGCQLIMFTSLHYNAETLFMIDFILTAGNTYIDGRLVTILYSIFYSFIKNLQIFRQKLFLAVPQTFYYTGNL